MVKTIIKLISLVMAFSVTANDDVIIKPFEFAHSMAFESKMLNQSRLINVYLPDGYDEDKSTTYPVIYLLDGSKDEDFIHIAGLVQFTNFPWLNILPKSIVVGISNIDRKHDFTTPSNNALDKKELPTHGGAKNFIRFLDEELRPLVNKQYRTNSTSTLIGQSLGGLLASEILFNHTQMFDHYVIISPSLWWDDESLLASKFEPKHFPQSVYIGVGKEGDVMERVAKALYQKISPKLKDKTQLKFNQFSQLSHGDTLHLAVYDAFNTINYQ
ncbi:alpha/beta hydrolase [Pseudoalteromonas sp. S16_S37]|uniref:alpha/beta hydrolase n=1 Tax=Pseudoalteromonas sp. S16_S37 TaxID=2720228 RepID=UPI00168171EA|nr:alpha/beta hydrolase-fold protein [Pseudoalteromonas sp. S16_S37]MBD1582593.1 alpha/beta hydrolase [Pseudoalteromonas sp. S16_S37]